MEIVFVILVAVIIIGGIAYSAYLVKKRREAMAAVAQSLGLTYQSAKDYSLASRFAFLNKLASRLEQIRLQHHFGKLSWPPGHAL